MFVSYFVPPELSLSSAKDDFSLAEHGFIETQPVTAVNVSSIKLYHLTHYFGLILFRFFFTYFIFIKLFGVVVCTLV